MKLVSPYQLAVIEAHLGQLLGRVLDAEGLAPLNAIIRDHVSSAGKRIRPQLCLWTYRNVCQRTSINAEPTPPVLDLACGWELFHAFLLVHDDIIDNADRRRDRPSLHRELARLDSNSRRFGRNLGIVAGDLLFSAAMRLWHDLDFPGDVYRRELQLFSRVACTTGFGQAIDICQSHVPLDAVQEEVLLREYHWKTAAYTFEGPMLSACIAAGMSEPAQAVISRFALALGKAYQLQNDLADLSAPVRDGCDLLEGKRTVTLVRGRAMMDEGHRRDFDRRFAALPTANGQAVLLAESLRRELHDCGAVEQTRSLIAEFLSDARSAADDRNLSPEFAESLRMLLNSLEADYFASPKSAAVRSTACSPAG